MAGVGWRFLKSRLLLRLTPKDEGPSGEELAAASGLSAGTFLQAIRDVASQLMARDQLGNVNFFARAQTPGKSETPPGDI